MTIASSPAVIGVFRDRKLAEQALEALKQANWGGDDPQIIERNAHGLFGVLKGARASRKDVVSEQKNIDVPLTHEEAYIERRPVTDDTIDDGTPIGEGEDIRIPLSQEQVNVTKNTVATGEVAIGKRSVEENQRVSDTVRREKARIEQQGDTPISGTERERLQAERADDENL